MDSSATSARVKKKFSSNETQSELVLKKNAKQSGKYVEEKNVEPQEKLCCPVEGCSWFTDLSKNRVGLLYHALEDHYGEVKPLELAFRVGNSKCSSCMRVMWSFEHFQHHVERHRDVPRHPCQHRGCTARFKSGMEMRRHARRHSPLQAVCCLPGCSQLFICLWALNLHEREHYATKPAKPDKNTNEQRGDKQDNTQSVKKQPDHKPKDATVNTTVSARKLRDATTRHVQAPLPTTVGATVLKEESKGQNETKVSHVLKNLSNKDTSTQPTGPNLRLRQTLREVTNPTKVISSSLKRKNKVRHKFKKKQLIVITKGPKRRGRPPKVKKAVYDENASAGQNKTVQLVSPTTAAETSSKSQTEETSRQDRDVVKTKSVNKQMKKIQAKQKVSHNTSAAIVKASLNKPIKSHKLTADSLRKLHKVTKHSGLKGRRVTSAKDSSKSKKVRNSKANTDTVKKPCPLKDAEGQDKTENGGQMVSSDFRKSKKVITNKANTDIKEICPLKEAEGPEKAENRGQMAENTDVKKNSLKDAEGKEERENDGQTVSSDSSKSKKVTASKANTDIKKLCPLKEAEGKAKAEKPTETDDSTPVIAADSLNVRTAPSIASGQKTKTTERKKSHNTKEGKKNATSGSGKTNKKHKDVKKKGGKDTQKDPSKTSALEKKSVDEQADAKAAAESSPDMEGDAKEGGSISAATASSIKETNLPKASKREKSKKSNVTNKPNNASWKRKSVQKESDTKIVKKKCKDPSAEMQSIPSVTTEPLAEVKAEVLGSPGYSVIMNGQAAKEDVKSTGFTDAPVEYRHKPYMRLPPTAYLDEKYITMPKRRKELSFFPSSQRSPPPQHANTTTALQRQRCANCFATFNSAEELQSHLQLQTCSSLFGFDSDDEGSGLTSPTKSVLDA